VTRANQQRVEDRGIKQTLTSATPPEEKRQPQRRINFDVARTSLRCGREEANLNLFLAKLIGELGDRVPGTKYRSIPSNATLKSAYDIPRTNSLAVLVDIIDQVDLASSVDGDLIPWADTETRVVARTEVHDALASSRVGLFVKSAGDGKFASNIGSQTGDVLQVLRVHQHSGRLSARRNVRASGRRDPVLDVGSGRRIGVEGLDIEGDGDNVHVQPKPRAKVWRLDRVSCQSRHGRCDPRTSFKSARVTPAPKNLQR
jgi:hypothetical protein